MEEVEETADIFRKIFSFVLGAGAGAKTHPVILVKPVPADRKLIRLNTNLQGFQIT